MSPFPSSTSDASMGLRQFHPAQMQPACIYRPIPFPWRVPGLRDADAGTRAAPTVRSVPPGSILLAVSHSAVAERDAVGSAELSDGERPDDALSRSVSDDELVISDRDDPDNGYVLPRIWAGATNPLLRKKNS